MSDSGLQFLSAGSVESLYVGSTYELKLGSVNEIMVGSEAKINAAVSNEFSLEAEMAFKAGCGVEWSNVGGYKIEQGEKFELKEESSQFATRELKFQAARTLPAQGPGVPLDAIKSTIKKALLALAAVNVAIGVAEGVSLGLNTLGETENRPNEEGVEQDGWKAGSVGLASSAVSVIGSLTAYALLKHSIEGLMEAYKLLPAISTVTLTETGIKQQTIPRNAASDCGLRSGRKETLHLGKHVLIVGVLLHTQRLTLHVHQTYRTVTIRHGFHGSWHAQSIDVIDHRRTVRQRRTHDFGLIGIN